MARWLCGTERKSGNPGASGVVSSGKLAPAWVSACAQAPRPALVKKIAAAIQRLTVPNSAPHLSPSYTRPPLCATTRVRPKLARGAGSDRARGELNDGERRQPAGAERRSPAERSRAEAETPPRATEGGAEGPGGGRACGGPGRRPSEP